MCPCGMAVVTVPLKMCYIEQGSRCWPHDVGACVCWPARACKLRGLRRQVGIGIFTKTSAEFAKRGENFQNELDFVGANIIMALVADFMLVWLPAPTLSFACVAAACVAFFPLSPPLTCLQLHQPHSCLLL